MSHRKKYFKQKMKITTEELHARALAHQTRSQLRKHDPSAYKCAKRKKLLDALYPCIGAAPALLTFEQLQVRAARFARRVDFKCGDDSAYKSALRQGFIPLLFPKRPPVQPKEPAVRYSLEMLRTKFSGVGSLSELRKVAPGAVEWLRRNNKTELLFPAYKPIRRFTADTALQAASAFSSRSHAASCDMALYSYLRKNDLLGKAFPKTYRTSRNDAVYLTRMLQQFYNGLPVYKVGVTSSHLGLSRIKSQNLNARAKHEVVIPPTVVVGSATDIEAFALTLGHNPKFVGFDGCTEYRAYSDGDLSQIKMMVELCSKEKP